MADNNNLFLFSLILFFCIINLSVDNHVVAARSLFSSTSCPKLSTSGMKESSSVLPMHYKHNPCYTQTTPNYTQILLQDKSRVSALHSRILKGGSSLTPEKVTIPANSGSSLNTGDYIVTLGFGTPKSDLQVIFDTGSDITWIQCLPCQNCHNQSDPIFDPSQSSSYSNISCSSSACMSLSSRNCSDSTCTYSILYGDNSTSVGVFGQETLTVSDLDVFLNFQFGCGQDNTGVYGLEDGLLGLGRAETSFISQTAAYYSKLFSYCIPTSSSQGFLSFGVRSTAVTNFTQLLINPSYPSFYFLGLEGISVDDNVLSINSSTFTSAGTIIDSGTVISRLPPMAYTALREAFQQAMVAMGYISAPAWSSLIDTCYNFTGVANVTTPKISLLFADGTNLEVPSVGVLLYPTIDMSQGCLAFAGNTAEDEVGILGNYQQQTLEVVYDVGAGLLGFGAGGCT